MLARPSIPAPPVTSASGRPGRPAGMVAEPLLGQVEGSFVLGADGCVEQFPVAQAHFRGHVPEQGHQCLQRHSGVHHGRGVGVPELVRDDVPEPGGPGCPVEFLAQGVLGQAAAVVGEQELGGPPVSRVAHRAAGRADLGDRVDQGESLLVERHHPFAVELAERDFQPGAGAGDLVHAVELEVEQLADPQPAGPLEQQRAGRQLIGRLAQRGGEPPVGVHGQVARQDPGQLRDVAGEDELPGRRVVPAPGGDVGEEVPGREDPLLLLAGGDRGAGAAVGGIGGRCEVGLDVTLPVQARQGDQAGVGPGEEPAEVHQPGGQAGDGLGLAGRQFQVQVGRHGRGDRGSDAGEPVRERDRFRPGLRRGRPGCRGGTGPGWVKLIPDW